MRESERQDPHPVTGQMFVSPVPPGSGWPQDPADPTTPVASDAATVAMLAAGSRDVATLDARISVCRACPRLVDWREQVAITGRRSAFATEPYWGRPGPGFGDPVPSVLIVGLAPAANGTNRTGRMFTGDNSGVWLYRALHRVGWSTDPVSRGCGDGLRLIDTRIVAAARCAPPANRPTGGELTTCRPWLVRDLTLAAPRLRGILALGAVAWNATLAAAHECGWSMPRPKPTFAHGAEVILTTKDPVKEVLMVASYHVSQQNTFTGRLSERMLDAVLTRLSQLRPNL